MIVCFMRYLNLLLINLINTWYMWVPLVYLGINYNCIALYLYIDYYKVLLPFKTIIIIGSRF